MSSPRLPGSRRVVAPARDGFTLTEPRIACPTGRPRFESEGTARERARLSRLLWVEVCPRCLGWHVRKFDAAKRRDEIKASAERRKP